MRDSPCGSDLQDLDHILWQCPLQDKERTVLITSLSQHKIFLSMRSKILMSEPKPFLCKIVEKFIIDCKLEI